MSQADRPVVLVVDDEPDVAETYRLWLTDEYDVDVATDGDEALATLDERVDVVLLDRMMPGLSGGEVLDAIRDRGLDCRVAMVTAVEPDFDILEMGFDAYLTKPVSGDHLLAAVENLLERSTYDALRQEYYALVEKRATLEATKSRAELAADEDYRQLVSRVDELRAELSDALGHVENDDDFVATIREFDDVD